MCFNQKKAETPAAAPQAAQPAPVEAPVASARTDAQRATYGTTTEPDFRRQTSAIPLPGGSGVKL